MQETWIRFLGWEDPLEEEMATHASILAWEISLTVEPGGRIVHYKSEERDTGSSLLFLFFKLPLSWLSG